MKSIKDPHDQKQNQWDQSNIMITTARNTESQFSYGIQSVSPSQNEVEKNPFWIPVMKNPLLLTL